MSCSICWSSPATVALIPCGHMCACEACSTRLVKATPRLCPVCREPIRDRIKIIEATHSVGDDSTPGALTGGVGVNATAGGVGADPNAPTTTFSVEVLQNMLAAAREAAEQKAAAERAAAERSAAAERAAAERTAAAERAAVAAAAAVTSAAAERAAKQAAKAALARRAQEDARRLAAQRTGGHAAGRRQQRDPAPGIVAALPAAVATDAARPFFGLCNTFAFRTIAWALLAFFVAFWLNAFAPPMSDTDTPASLETSTEAPRVDLTLAHRLWKSVKDANFVYESAVELVYQRLPANMDSSPAGRRVAQPISIEELTNSISAWAYILDLHAASANITSIVIQVFTRASYKMHLLTLHHYKEGIADELENVLGPATSAALKHNGSSSVAFGAYTFFSSMAFASVDFAHALSTQSSLLVLRLAASKHSANASIVQIAMEALENIVYWPEVSANLTTKDAFYARFQPLVLNFVIETLRVHANDLAIFCAACRVITRMSHIGSTSQFFLYDGAMESIQTAFDSWSPVIPRCVIQAISAMFVCLDAHINDAFNELRDSSGNLSLPEIQTGHEPFSRSLLGHVWSKRIRKRMDYLTKRGLFEVVHSPERVGPLWRRLALHTWVLPGTEEEMMHYLVPETSSASKKKPSQ